MRSARKPVFRLKPSATEHHDQVSVWSELLRSLNPTHEREEGRRDRLHKLMSDVLEQNVRPESPTLHMWQIIGDRWAPLILFILSTGTFRHSELQRVVNVFSEMSDATPISQRVLTLKLRMLERDGFLTRTVWPIVPPRADYALTPLGQSLIQLLEQVVSWSEKNGAKMVAAQRNYDSANEP